MPEKKHYTFDELHAMAVAAREPKRVGAASSRPSSKTGGETDRVGTASSRPSSRTGGETPPPQGNGSPSQFDQAVRGRAIYAPDDEWVPLTFDRSTDPTADGREVGPAVRRGVRNDAPLRNLYIDDTGLGLTPVPPSDRRPTNYSGLAHGEGPFDRYFSAPTTASPSRRWSTIEDDASMKGDGPHHDGEDSAHGDPIQADRPSDEWDGADGSVATDDLPPPKYVGEEGDDGSEPPVEDPDQDEPPQEVPPPRYPPPEDPPDEPPIEQPKCTCTAACTPKGCPIVVNGLGGIPGLGLVDWAALAKDPESIIPKPTYDSQPELTITLDSKPPTTASVKITSDERNITLFMVPWAPLGTVVTPLTPRQFELPLAWQSDCPDGYKFKLALTDKGWKTLILYALSAPGTSVAIRIDTLKVYLDGNLCEEIPVTAQMICDEVSLDQLRFHAEQLHRETMTALVEATSSVAALANVGGRAGDVKAMGKGADGKPLAAVMQLFLTGFVSVSTLESTPDCCCRYADSGKGKLEWVIHHAEGAEDSVVKPLLDSLIAINAALLTANAANIQNRVRDAFNKTVADWCPACGRIGGGFSCVGSRRNIEDYNKPVTPPFGHEIASYPLTNAQVEYWEDQARRMRGESDKDDEANPYWCLGWPDDPKKLDTLDYTHPLFVLAKGANAEGASARAQLYRELHAIAPSNPWLECAVFVSKQVVDISESALSTAGLLREIDDALGGLAQWIQDAVTLGIEMVLGDNLIALATRVEGARDWGFRFGAALFEDAKLGIPLLLGWATPSDTMGNVSTEWKYAADVCSESGNWVVAVPGRFAREVLQNPCIANANANTRECCEAMVAAEQIPGGRNVILATGGPPSLLGLNQIPAIISPFLPWHATRLKELIEPLLREFYHMRTMADVLSEPDGVVRFAKKFCCDPLGNDSRRSLAELYPGPKFMYAEAARHPRSNRFGRIPRT